MAAAVEVYLNNDKFVKRIYTSFTQLDRHKKGYVSREDYFLGIKKLAELAPGRPDLVAKAEQVTAEFCDAFGLKEGVKADEKKLVELAAAMGVAESTRRRNGEETLTAKVHNAIYDIVDETHDGYVSLPEYRKVMEASDHSPEATEATFNVLDKEKEGKIKRSELIDAAIKFWCELDNQETKGMFGDKYD